jgi:transposase-like protein
MNGKQNKKKTKCPHCNTLYNFTEIQFDSRNDSGYWEVKCENCDNEFHLEVSNPNESSMEKNYLVKSRHLDDIGFNADISCSSVIEYELNLNEQVLKFNYDAIPIYLCPSCNENMELLALSEFRLQFNDVKRQYKSIVDCVLAGQGSETKNIVIKIPVTCSCGKICEATYYTKFLLTGRVQEIVTDYHLADISECDIKKSINGLYTKSEIMQQLEKLLIRWNLFCLELRIVTPFVGYTYLKKEQKLATWNWILSQCDASKVKFITRAETLNSYKKVLEDVDGLKDDMLKDWGLENKLISANTKKNDFHAKFYAGMFNNRVEVLHGSANIVSGPSIENATLSEYSITDFDVRYTQKLNMNLNNPKGSIYAATIQKDKNDWILSTIEL